MIIKDTKGRTVMLTKARSKEYEQTRPQSGFCKRVIRREATETERIVIYK